MSNNNSDFFGLFGDFFGTPTKKKDPFNSKEFHDQWKKTFNDKYSNNTKPSNNLERILKIDACGLTLNQFEINFENIGSTLSIIGVNTAGNIIISKTYIVKNQLESIHNMGIIDDKLIIKCIVKSNPIKIIDQRFTP